MTSQQQNATAAHGTTLITTVADTDLTTAPAECNCSRLWDAVSVSGLLSSEWHSGLLHQTPASDHRPVTADMGDQVSYQSIMYHVESGQKCNQ